MFEQNQQISVTVTATPTVYSQKSLESWMLAKPASQRAALVREFTGTSSGYVLKRIYTRDYVAAPTFKLRIAVGLDKASKGEVDFRDMIEDNEAIDWRYVARVLNKRLREENKRKKALDAAKSVG